MTVDHSSGAAGGALIENRKSKIENPLPFLLLLLLLLFLFLAVPALADWRADLSPPEPGPFPPLRPIKLEYQCGWSGLTAGRVNAQFSHPGADTCELDATAATTGLARALWRLDATHEARGDLAAIKPLTVRQQEIYRAQTVRTELDFDEKGVARLRESTGDKNPARRKRYEFPNLYDLQTALLYVRSQKLDSGAVYRMVVYPATAPYLATVTVLGREAIRVKAGSYPAIKMDLRLQKITGDMTLAPHGKFKRATAWLSDDADRLPLRMNAQLFVGSVWVELTKAD
jgi:hypothetical protein